MSRYRCVLHVKEFPEKLFEDCEDLFAVKEYGKSGDNPHFHVVFKSKLKISGFRNRLQKSDLIPKRSYSLGEGYDEGYVRYMCKGENQKEPLVIKNEINVDVKFQQKEYWEQNKSYSSKGCQDKFKLYLQFCIDKKLKNDNMLDISENVVDFHFEYSKTFEKGFNKNIVEMFAWKVCAYFDNDVAKLRLKDKIKNLLL